MTQEVEEITGAFNIVVLNILAGPLVQNARNISDRIIIGGSLALSGILAEQAESATHAHRDRIDFELAVTDQPTDQTWVRLRGKRI